MSATYDNNPTAEVGVYYSHEQEINYISHPGTEVDSVRTVSRMGLGLSLSNGNGWGSNGDPPNQIPYVTYYMTGTPTASGTTSGSMRVTFEDGTSEVETFVVVVKAASVVKVTSISTSGVTRLYDNQSGTITATSSPSNATNRGVTFSASSGGTIVSQSTTSTGGTCTVKKGTASGFTVTATAADGSGVTATHNVAQDSDTYTATLYFNANKGSGAPSTMEKDYTDWYGTGPSGSHSFTIPSTTPSRSGYDFLGWSTSSSASSAGYTAGDTISVSYGSSKTLYAVWQVKKSYYYARLYYDANGGSGAPSTQSDSIYASSASGSKTFTISSTKPTKSGYTFLGWSTSSGASSASYQPGGTISIAYGVSKTLYAVWKKVCGSANIDGTWKDIQTIYVKKNGEWKQITAGYAKVNGIWKQLF